MYADDTDALARQSAVTDIRAFLASDGLREEALASYINRLSQRYRLDIATTRRLFVAEVKKQALQRLARRRGAPASPSSPDASTEAEAAWSRRPTAEVPRWKDPGEDG